MDAIFKAYIQKLEKQLEKASAKIKMSSISTPNSLYLNGSRMVVRKADPADAENLFQMHRRLSKATLYNRYLTHHKPQLKEMETVSSFSGSRGAAFVALRDDPDGNIIGLAYYCFDPIQQADAPEFAIVVEDQFQGKGVGRALIKHLCRYAKETKVQSLNAFIHHQNRGMRHLLRCTGYPYDARFEVDTWKATIHLQSKARTHEKRFLNIDPIGNLFQRYV